MNVFFYYESKFKIFFSLAGPGEGKGARVSDFFLKESKSKKKLENVFMKHYAPTTCLTLKGNGL